MLIIQLLLWKKNYKINQLGNFKLNKILYKQFFNINRRPGMYCGGDFEDLITESTIFVDKSLFIKEVIEDPSEVILINMPRR